MTSPWASFPVHSKRVSPTPTSQHIVVTSPRSPVLLHHEHLFNVITQLMCPESQKLGQIFLPVPGAFPALSIAGASKLLPNE